MGSRVRILVATCSLTVIAACYIERNSYYCDATTPCKDPSLPNCDLNTHACTSAAVNDLGMPILGDMAHPVCVKSTDCDSSAPICVDNACRRCSGSSDDGACKDRNSQLPHCGPEGACVACTTATQDSDCGSTTTTPICGATFTCRACQANSECATKVCIFDGPDAGKCAAASQVVYVNNRGGVAACKVMHATATGTATDPFCDIDAAIATQLPYVVVAGAGSTPTPAPYTALNINNRTVRLLGPGRTASPTALIAGSLAADGVTISGTSVVQMDGFEITGAGSTHNGVSCGSGSKVTITNSNIHGNGRAGVSTSNCDATLDANLIMSNALGGVQLTGGTATVTNNLISGNGSSTDAMAFGGLAIDRTTTVSAAAFNTIYKNHVVAGVGGIDCGTGLNKTISNSISWDNDGAQTGAQCMGSVFSGTGTGANAPVFVADGHLQAGIAANDTCCVDKVASPNTPNSGHDVDGQPRPQGQTGKWTIGANELAQ